MSPNPRRSTPGEALNFHRAFCEMVLEATDADADEIILSLKRDPEEFEDQAREAWTKALSENVSNAVHSADNQSVQNKPEPNVVQRGFSSLMAILRRSKDMEITELALSAQVNPKELTRVESEPGYMPSPRTIVQLEGFFRLPKDTLGRLSGAVTKGSDSFQGDLMKFAACSKGMGKLTIEEKKLLNEFVKHLVRRK
jgi:hypothetical protein